MYNYFPEVFMKKFVLVIIIVLYLSSSLLVAAVDPAWYKITHSLGDWLSMGTKNLDDNPISNMYLGHYDINRAEGYENTKQGSVKRFSGGEGYQYGDLCPADCPQG